MLSLGVKLDIDPLNPIKPINPLNPLNPLNPKPTVFAQSALRFSSSWRRFSSSRRFRSFSSGRFTFFASSWLLYGLGLLGFLGFLGFIRVYKGLGLRAFRVWV